MKTPNIILMNVKNKQTWHQKDSDHCVTFQANSLSHWKATPMLIWVLLLALSNFFLFVAFFSMVFLFLLYLAVDAAVATTINGNCGCILSAVLLRMTGLAQPNLSATWLHRFWSRVINAQAECAKAANSSGCLNWLWFVGCNRALTQWINTYIKSKHQENANHPDGTCWIIILHTGSNTNLLQKHGNTNLQNSFDRSLLWRPLHTTRCVLVCWTFSLAGSGRGGVIRGNE